MAATPGDGGDVRRFHPTSGTAVGWFGIGLAVIAIATVLYDGLSLTGARVALVAAIFAGLVWCFMLRPRVVLGRAEVELRNAFSSWHVPLARVRAIAVRAITRVSTDEGHYDGIAVGRPLRSLTGRQQPAPKVGLPGLGQSAALGPAGDPNPRRNQLDANATADFLVERVLQAADRARESGVAPGVARRTWAWPELAALTFLLAALVVTVLV